MALKNVGLWVLQVGAAGIFLMAGGAKLGSDPKMIGVFDAIGLGQWFRYLTGGLEVLGAIGLLTPLSGAAALGLATVMVGAVGAHVLVLGGSAAPALVLLIAATLIAYGRRDQITGLLRQVAK